MTLFKGQCDAHAQNLVFVEKQKQNDWPQKDGSKKKKTYHFDNELEAEFFVFTNVKEACVCLICWATVATAKWHNAERHFTTCHTIYNANYPPGSTLQTEKARDLKAAFLKFPKSNQSLIKN